MLFFIVLGPKSITRGCKIKKSEKVAGVNRGFFF